jgi:predicted nucleotidyltransferase
MYGLSEKTVESIQDVVKKYLVVEKVILYGSRTKGNFRNGSDIEKFRLHVR